MKLGFYPRLAVDGLKKNRQMYLPYLLTCTLMVAVYYILAFLTKSGILKEMPGGDSIGMVLRLGCWVMIVFSILFLFYTNSFLIRRRKKEFGLYNVLGMNKRNLAHIVLWETIATYLVATVSGILLGIAVSKLSELVLIKVVRGDLNFDFCIPLSAVTATAGLFGIIFLLILLNSIRQVGFAKPIDLIRSTNTGEKPPKANWVIGLLGIIILGAAYYLAVSIEEPLLALMAFFVAVVMVIVATYMIFIAGSVMICRLLQKNKNYYYKKNHFVSVSSMAYRMKRNGAGLASICILLTMVLVMITSSASLYYGAEDALDTRYPREICTEAYVYGYDENNLALAEDCNKKIDATLSDSKVQYLNDRAYSEYSIAGSYENGVVNPELDDTTTGITNYDKIAQVHFIPLADYNRISGEKIELDDGEALVLATMHKDIGDTLKVGDSSFKVKPMTNKGSFDLDGSAMAMATENLFVIVPDINKAVEPLAGLVERNGTPMLMFKSMREFDLDDASPDTHKAVVKSLNNALESNVNIDNVNCDSRLANHEDVFGTFGGLFFIGIILSAVFLVAAVIIIYYKQLSEGFEDQSRFDIMQKIGMTKGEIHKSINSQMLLVFLLPIAFAILHLSFAFPFIHKLLMLFGLTDYRLQILTSGISVLMCTVFYIAVYKLTSNAYYHIVSDTSDGLRLTNMTE